MKSVMISIRPEWCAKIANGEKTIEVRKTKPKLETPFKCYIYCTLAGSNKLFKETLGGDIAKWNREKWADRKGNVIGEFVCDDITYFGNVATDPWKYLLGAVHEEYKRLITEEALLTEEEILQYKGRYGWHISALVIYDRPKKINEFVSASIANTNCFGEQWHLLDRPPQSWCYVKKGH